MHHRRAFTLLEVTVVSGLTVFLAVLLSSAWSAIGRPASDLAGRGQIVQEMELAVTTLSRDLGGSSVNPSARLGDKSVGRWVGWTQPGNNQLWLCFDGGTEPNGQADWTDPDSVIVYHLDGDTLLRWDHNAGTTFAVARDLTDLAVTAEGTDAVRIVLSFESRGITRTCTLIARSP